MSFKCHVSGFQSSRHFACPTIWDENEMKWSSWGKQYYKSSNLHHIESFDNISNSLNNGTRKKSNCRKNIYTKWQRHGSSKKSFSHQIDAANTKRLISNFQPLDVTTRNLSLSYSWNWNEFLTKFWFVWKFRQSLEHFLSIWFSVIASPPTFMSPLNRVISEPRIVGDSGGEARLPDWNNANQRQLIRVNIISLPIKSEKFSTFETAV